MVGNVGQSPTSEPNLENQGNLAEGFSRKRPRKAMMRWLRIANKGTYFRPKRGAWVLFDSCFFALLSSTS